MQCYVISSENLIQEISLPYGQLVRLKVCRNLLVRIRTDGPFRVIVIELRQIELLTEEKIMGIRMATFITLQSSKPKKRCSILYSVD